MDRSLKLLIVAGVAAIVANLGIGYFFGGIEPIVEVKGFSAVALLMLASLSPLALSLIELWYAVANLARREYKKAAAAGFLFAATLVSMAISFPWIFAP